MSDRNERNERGPNHDDGFDVNPPSDVDMPRTSDDNDYNPVGSGVSETPLRPANESIAHRDDLARRLEGLVASAREWASDDGSEEARDIAEGLADLYDRLDVPLEDTDGATGNI